MTADPYADMAQWLDMDARTEAIMRHPAGKALMSDDEAQARMDAEACRVGSLNWRINEAHHRWSTRPRQRARRRWLEVALPALTTVSVGVFLFLDVFVINGPVIA